MPDRDRHKCAQVWECCRDGRDGMERVMSWAEGLGTEANPEGAGTIGPSKPSTGIAQPADRISSSPPVAFVTTDKPAAYAPDWPEDGRKRPKATR